MPTVTEIQSAIEQLPAVEADKLREWFLERDAAQWDAEFEQDAQSGKLDALAAQALADYDNGNTKPL